MTLTKADIIKSVTKQNGFTERRSKEIVEILIELIKDTLASGDDVLFSNFGRFCVKEKKEKKTHSPIAGGYMVLRARRVVTFRCSGNLRKKING